MVSCIVTQFVRESFGICRFRSSCIRACLHEGGEPQVAEVTRLGGVTRLSI